MKPTTKLLRALGLKRYGYAEIRGDIAFQAGVPLLHEKGRKLNHFIIQKMIKT